jgi:hypothetical protein
VAKTFYAAHTPLRSVAEVRVGGSPLPASSYCFDLDEGWIALSAAPPSGSGNVEIDYVYSRKPDLLVTNWDPDDPNICFLNDVATTVAGAPPAGPALRLLPNYPEPFNPLTLIPVQLGEARWIDVTIYDLRGRQVRSLYAGHRSAGRHEFSWDGTDESRRPVASGVYFYRGRVGRLFLPGDGGSALRHPSHDADPVKSPPGEARRTRRGRSYHALFMRKSPPAAR